MATPTTGTLLNNHFDSLTSFFIEMGNMVYNIKKCREETNPDKKADYLIQASISFGLATESIATLINGPMGGKIGIAGNTLIGGRLLINVTKFTEEWSDGKIDINRTQNIMADFFTLTGSALSMSKNPVKKGIGLGAKKVGDIIGAIALKTGETGTMSKEDFFNGENFKNFIIDEYLQPLSDAIYDLFDQIDNRISSLLNNQDDSWIQLIIDKLDSQRLTELPEGSLVQHAVIAQLNDWYYYKVTNNEYNGEKFFSDNKDVLQYTTAQGEGFLNVSSKSDKYIDNFLIYVSRQLCDNEFLLWSFIKSEQHQWNIVTNTKGGNATAMDNEKTQFMLGNDGNDTLIGGDLNDIIIGSNGNDYLYGGLGSDKLYGGAGFDTYEFKTGEMNWDYIYDHNGDGQVIIDGINFSTFKFTKKPNADSIWEYKIGSNNWWAMLNENGNLILMLGPNRIVIENYKSMGGNKLGITLSDEVTGENQTNYLLWEGDVRPETDEDGKYLVNWLDHAERDINGVLIKGTKQVGFNDVMAGLAGINNKIYGLAGNDALHGRDKDDIIDGGDDDDLIAGGGGIDTIYGGSGNDFIYSNMSIGMLLRYSDNDQWIPKVSQNIEIVTQGSTWGIYIIEEERIVDGGTNSYIQHADNNEEKGDTLYGGSGNDMVVAGNNNDIIYGDEADNEQGHQIGEDGDDELFGMGGDDIIYGGGGNDIINGDSYNSNNQNDFKYLQIEEHGNDIINGNDGNDAIYGNGGNDIIFGDDGDDWIGGDFNNLPEVASYSDINGNDFIDGGDGDDEIHGGGGDDSIIGDKGNDRIWGDYGNSELAHISGNDSIDGGDGNDTIVAGGGNDTILGGDGDDLVIGDYYNSQLTHISGNDTIDGGNGNDQLIGSGGDDHIIGGSGNDMLWGDFDGNVKTDIAGNDYLDGGDGDDYLEAGKGDDTLVAGSGKDILIGGEGKDSYVFISTDLQDGQINTIFDEDGKGIIIIDGVALDSHDWQAVAENVWQTDNMQLNIIQENNNSFLVWQSTSTTSLIAIQNYQNGDLSLNLPAYNPPSADTNHAPEVNETLAEQTIIVNQTYNFTLPENLFIDPDGDTLTYSINNLPAWLKFDPQTKTLSGTATIDQIGKLQLTITATDKQGLTATQNFNINIINNPNTPPQTNYSNLTHNIITHIPFEHALPADLFTDADNDALSYKIEDLPNGINFNSQTNTISGVATQAQLIETTIQCGDGQDYSYLPYIINIIENRPPKVKNKISQLNTGATKYFEYTIPADLFTDPDGEILNINVNNLPQWLNYNPQTNTINGIAPIESAGINNITIIATDNANNSIEHTLQINVNLDNIPNAIYANGLKIGTLKNDLMIGNNQNNTIRGNAGDDTIHGLDGDDEIHGGIGNDTLNGGSGNDKIFGEVGNDSLNGGIGDDRLEGGLGNDAYHFTKGDGKDSIYDLGGTETLHLQQINKNEIYFEQQSNNLIIKIIGTNDQLTIQNHYLKFLGNPNAIETIQLDNGETIDIKTATPQQLNSQVNSKSISLSNFLVSSEINFPSDTSVLDQPIGNNQTMEYGNTLDTTISLSNLIDDYDNNGGGNIY